MHRFLRLWVTGVEENEVSVCINRSRAVTGRFALTASRVPYSIWSKAIRTIVSFKVVGTPALVLETRGCSEFPCCKMLAAKRGQWTFADYQSNGKIVLYSGRS